MPDDDPQPDEPTFDLEAEFDSDVRPLLAEIFERCRALGIPMLASFCYRNDGDGGGMLSTSCLFREDWAPAVFDAAYWVLTDAEGPGKDAP